MFPTKRSSHRAGFTLTELLVVILIIAVLAALGFTGITKMRSMADRATSTRNIAQLQLVNTTHASDNNGNYIKVYAFDDKGSSYVPWHQNSSFLSILKGDSVFLANGKLDMTVPSHLLDPVAFRSKKPSTNEFSASYGYNQEGITGNIGWATPNSQRGFAISQLTAPDRSAAFFTATDWLGKYSGRFLWKGSAAVEGYANGKVAYRHNNKALVAYYDGHVGEMSQEDMRRIDNSGGIKNIFWDGDATGF